MDKEIWYYMVAWWGTKGEISKAGLWNDRRLSGHIQLCCLHGEEDNMTKNLKRTLESLGYSKLRVRITGTYGVQKPKGFK